MPKKVLDKIDAAQADATPRNHHYTTFTHFCQGFLRKKLKKFISQISQAISREIGNIFWEIKKAMKMLSENTFMCMKIFMMYNK